MTCRPVNTWVVIPVRAPDDGKTRLAETLDTAQRSALVAAMLEQVVSAACSAANVDHVCLIGPSRHGLPRDLPLLDDPGKGLNAAACAAMQAALQNDASRVVILFADLPQLAARDVELLAAAPPGTIAIAPDRHDTGTNALSLPLPQAEGFNLAFGPDSCARHRAEAERLGLALETIRSPGLSRDVDEPDDLPDAAGLL